MSREAEVLRIFIASPSDVSPEREVVAKAVEELNRALAPGMGVHLEIIRWETHAHPAFGSDPQDLINRQIGSDYEIFIGILWAKFGSPTPRAASGTLEEFQRAKERYERDPGSISVMFYFKEEPIVPTEVDVEQLARVQQFRKELGKEALYGTFNSEEDLGSNIRLHLTRVLLERKDLRRSGSELSRSSLPASGSDLRESFADNSSKSEGEDETEEGEEGLLDLVESGTSNLVESGAIINRMGGHLRDLTSNISQASSELQGVDFSKGGNELSRGKKIINDLADQMEYFSDKMQAEMVVFGDIYPGAIGAIGRASLVMADFEGSRGVLAENLDAIRGMAETIPSARAVMATLRESVDQQPRVTTKYNRAKRRVQKALSDVDRQFSAAYTLTRELVSLIEAQLAKSKE